MQIPIQILVHVLIQITSHFTVVANSGEWYFDVLYNRPMSEASTLIFRKLTEAAEIDQLPNTSI